ncbi:hypothetical protein [Okeania sp. SIO2B3]|uniref:hypothetical protein n=1 Tax=Okeania sp. SIO2B3 TaxID=2607784 RepID=UPI0013C15B3A|nr:hypothetical protein [Okeania sp. SIO2B3]NET42781.1 hypothetical protein [Okeania sp. SIO2B3]
MRTYADTLLIRANAIRLLGRMPFAPTDGGFTPLQMVVSRPYRWWFHTPTDGGFTVNLRKSW